TDDPREERALRRSELAERLPEVDVRGLDEAVDRDRAVLAEIHGVEVAAEYLVLARVRFEEEREHGFARFAPERPVWREEDVLHELLRQRAPALLPLAVAEVGHERAPDRERIDPGVPEEVPVLRGEEGVATYGRRRIRARLERGTAAAERRQHLGLELDAVRRGAVVGPDVGDPAGADHDAHAARRRRPRHR